MQHYQHMKTVISEQVPTFTQFIYNSVAQVFLPTCTVRPCSQARGFSKLDFIDIQVNFAFSVTSTCGRLYEFLPGHPCFLKQPIQHHSHFRKMPSASSSNDFLNFFSMITSLWVTLCRVLYIGTLLK